MYKERASERRNVNKFVLTGQIDKQIYSYIRVYYVLAYSAADTQTFWAPCTDMYVM